ncbi:uncharacterized protein LOC131680888 [Topomyia yanbarensis]|uniref:uncharacterized protein LOC131680888 n=1 Tax=Topomyia yanbarensis TaxID=2498891 RepID=UPI00273B370F|nr:uncharacterized protein LOC131680888 [Topomyia yanbarensis]
MKWFYVGSFFQALHPIYLVSRAFSLSSVTINFQDETAEQTTADQLVLIRGLCMCCLALYFSYGAFRAQLERFSDSHIFNAGMFGSMSAFVGSLMAAIISNYANGLEVFRGASILNKVDQQDKSAEQTPTDQLVLILGIFLCCSTLCFSHRIFRVQLQQMSDSTILTFGLYGSMIVSVCSLLTTIISNYVNGLEVFRGATVLNKVDQQTTPERDPQKLTDTESCCKMVRKFAMIHAQLCDTIEVFNRCFSTQAMFALASAFGFTVFSVFGVIHSHVISANEATLRMAWSNMTYDGFYIAFIVQLIVFSSLVFVECKRTSVMIHKVICYGTYDRNVRKELRIFSQQLWHHAPKVSCNLFDFDWTLFYTMAASLTTYLVILMQFDLANIDYANSADKKNLAPR